MLPLASGHLYNKTQNHEWITKPKKRKPESQLSPDKLESHFLSEKREKEEEKLQYLLYKNVQEKKKKNTLKWKCVLTEVGFSGRVLLIKEKEVASYPQALKAFQNWNSFITP